MLPALRSALYLLWLVATVVPWALAVLVASIFIRGDPLYWMCVGWCRVAIWGARTICGVRWRIGGMEQLPRADQTAPMLLAPKHQSTWETLALPTLMPHPLCYVFKRELLLIPFFGWAMARLDMIHIDRESRAAAMKHVIEQGKAVLSQGTWVIMFPEGTRIPRGEKGTYQTAGTRLAVESGAPVVPIAVSSGKCWPREGFTKYPGVVQVSIGKPIPSVGREPKALMREVEAWIEAEMRRIDPEAYPDAKT